MKPVEAPKALAGGGGGGNASKIFESKGHLPKVAPEQFTPPTVEILNNKPKLAMEATVVAPANVKLPDNPNMPNMGNPMSARVSGPASNGTGTGGGIGSGTNNGIGSGAGPGHGPGQGGGFGGGTYKIGDIGVSPPVAKFTPEPDFRKKPAKQSIRAQWFWLQWLVRMAVRATSEWSAVWAWAWMRKPLSG